MHLSSSLNNKDVEKFNRNWWRFLQYTANIKLLTYPNYCWQNVLPVAVAMLGDVRAA